MLEITSPPTSTKSCLMSSPNASSKCRRASPALLDPRMDPSIVRIPPNVLHELDQTNRNRKNNEIFLEQKKAFVCFFGFGFHTFEYALKFVENENNNKHKCL